MKSCIRRIGLAAAFVLLGGCQLDWVREHPLGCRGDEQLAVRDALYFGRSIPGGGEVDDAAWRAFEASTLLPSFPRGYTVLDAAGRWRGEDGSTIGEASRVVLVVHAGDRDTDAKVRAVIARYRAQFRQESVLRERTAACVAF